MLVLRCAIVALWATCFFRFGLPSGLERAAHSADHMFSLYFDYLLFQLFPVFGT